MKTLRDRRKAAGLTLIQAGTVINMDTGNLSRIERGKQLPGYKVAMRLADLYNITLDQVYGHKREKLK